MNRKLALVLLVLVGAIVALVAWRRDDARAPAASAPTADATPAAPAAPADDVAIDEPPRESEAAEPRVASEATAAPSAQSAPAVAASEPPAKPARIRVHVVTPEGEPFARELDPALSDPRHWAPFVLVTLEPTMGPEMARIPADGGRELGDFTPRAARSTLPATCIGELELSTPPPVFATLALYSEWLGCELLAPSQEDVRFVLDPAAFAPGGTGVRVRIVDTASKLPVAGAQVGLLTGTAGRSKGSSTSSRRDGSATIDPWSAGPCRLRVEKSGYATVQRELVVRRGEVTDVGDVEIEAVEPVRVRVKPDVPSERISLSCHTLEEARNRQASHILGAAIHLGEDGEYEVYPGEAALVLHARTDAGDDPGLGSEHVIVERSQAGTTVELELRPIVPVSLHTAWIGEGRTIEILDARDILISRAASYAASPISLQLVSGTYRVLFGGAEGAPAARMIEIADTATEITLD